MMLNSSLALNPMAPRSPARQRKLVLKLRAKDDDAYEFVHRTYAPAMLAVAQRFLRCEEDARDCVQDALFKAFRKMNDFEARGPLGGWLRRITINTALMKIRARRARPEALLENGATLAEDTRIDRTLIGWSTPENILADAETRTVVRRAIARLPKSYRRILMLRDIEGHSTAEAAQVLGIQPSTAKVRLHRARAALKKSLLSEQCMALECFIQAS